MSRQSNRKKFRPIVKWILWALLFQFLLINLSASLHAWKQTHFYTDPELHIYHPASKNIFSKTWKLFTGIKYPRNEIRYTPSFPVDTVTLHTTSGIRIDCWYGAADSAAKGTVILFHGLSGNKGYILPEANEFRYLGYNVMLVDFRGHGNSGGNATTIGFRESEEVKLAFDFVKKKGGKNIFLYGSSMGAVVIAKAINDYVLEPAGIIMEMPIASLQSFLEARARTMGFPGEPFGFLVTGWIGIEQGFNGYGHRPTAYVRKITCPVLLQWGDRDQFVSKNEIQTIYNNIPGVKKRLTIYENAEHQSLCRYDPLKWRTEVKELLDGALQ